MTTYTTHNNVHDIKRFSNLTELEQAASVAVGEYLNASTGMRVFVAYRMWIAAFGAQVDHVGVTKALEYLKSLEPPHAS